MSIPEPRFAIGHRTISDDFAEFSGYIEAAEHDRAKRRAA